MIRDPMRRVRLLDQDHDTGVDEAWEARFLGGVLLLAVFLWEALGVILR